MLIVLVVFLCLRVLEGVLGHETTFSAEDLAACQTACRLVLARDLLIEGVLVVS